MKTKHCNKCNTTKNVEEFNKNKSKKDGLSSICKSCHSRYRKEHYLKNKDKVINQVKLYNKKSGRNYKSICKNEKCSNVTYITKKDISNNVKRYCSRGCSTESRKKSPCTYQYRSVLKSANKRNIEFNLSVKFLEDLILNQNNRCAITNVPITINRQHDTT